MASSSTSLAVFLTVLIACLVSPPETESAHIVFYCAVSSYSHRVPVSPVAEALAEKGHQVTFISPYPGKSSNPKIHDLVPTKLKEWMDSFVDGFDMFEKRRTATLLGDVMIGPEFGRMACNKLYNDDAYLKWMKEAKVDLVFIDSVFNECGYGMAWYWKAKMMIFDTTTTFGWYSDSFGLPDETNSYPETDLHYPANMTFFQRAKNALLPVFFNIMRNWMYFPYLEQLTKEKLGLSEVPSFAELEGNASVILINSHYGEEFPRSLPPSVVPIGGIGYVEKRKPLPKDLDEFLKKGKEFIYVSFGTFADFTKLEHERQQAIIGAMRSMPKMQFVWKVSNASLATEFPAGNVYIGSWMPQQDILAHPKIKAFVTHSGLLGIQEAVYNAVPLISFPIFSDQDYNAERIHRKEYGIRLEILTVTQDQMEDAINRVVTDPKYHNNMKRVSTMFKERPMKPLETALWWTDFVLRHSEEELVTLRPLNIGQPWWRKRQLDVWAFMIVTAVTVLSFSLYLLLKIFTYFCSSKSSSGNESRKKKMQ